MGEFTELGFEVGWRFARLHGDDELDAFWDDFIDTIEARGLSIGGGGDGVRGGGFVTRPAPPGASESDRTFLRDWLAAYPSVGEVSAGPLVDAWS